MRRNIQSAHTRGAGRGWGVTLINKEILPMVERYNWHTVVKFFVLILCTLDMISFNTVIISGEKTLWVFA